MSDLTDVLYFCPGCFATNEDGSWGHTCQEEYCYNCGSSGTVKLPRWAVRSIREQASWVGKRYYPHDEDKQAADELAALRELAPANPTDRAEYDSKLGDYWSVWRFDPVSNTRFGISPVRAATADEAIRKARSKLRYIPLEHYKTPGDTDDE